MPVTLLRSQHDEKLATPTRLSMKVDQMAELFKEAYSDIELDEPTEAEWDEHLLRELQEADADRYAAIPEREI